MHVGPLCPHSSCSPASAVCHHRQPSIATVEFIVREREQQHREPVRPTHAKFPWPCGEEAVVCPSACVSALHSRTLFAGPAICPISRHFGRLPTRATNILKAPRGKDTAHSFSTINRTTRLSSSSSRLLSFPFSFHLLIIVPQPTHMNGSQRHFRMEHS